MDLMKRNTAIPLANNPISSCIDCRGMVLGKRGRVDELVVVIRVVGFANLTNDPRIGASVASNDEL